MRTCFTKCIITSPEGYRANGRGAVTAKTLIWLPSASEKVLEDEIMEGNDL